MLGETDDHDTGGVRGASGGGGGGNGVGGSSAAGRVNVVEAGASAQRGQLPFTGLDTPLIAFAGMAAIAAGALLRRRLDGASR